MKAKDMFEKLGFKMTVLPNDDIMYKDKDDYVDYSVTFDVSLKQYSFDFKRWEDDCNHSVWVPMEARGNDFAKHSAKYGYWITDLFRDITLDMHKAIHQQCRELGWL